MRPAPARSSPQPHGLPAAPQPGRPPRRSSRRCLPALA
jgi:hypothetical protein